MCSDSGRAARPFPQGALGLEVCVCVGGVTFEVTVEQGLWQPSVSTGAGGADNDPDLADSPYVISHRTSSPV